MRHGHWRFLGRARYARTACASEGFPIYLWQDRRARAKTSTSAARTLASGGRHPQLASERSRSAAVEQREAICSKRPARHDERRLLTFSDSGQFSPQHEFTKVRTWSRGERPLRFPFRCRPYPHTPHARKTQGTKCSKTRRHLTSRYMTLQGGRQFPALARFDDLSCWQPQQMRVIK